MTNGIELELTNILENFTGFTPDMLYDDLTILPDKTSSFSESEFNKFIILFSLLSINPNNLDSLQIRSYWQKIAKLNPNKLLKMKQNLKEKLNNWIPLSNPNINSNKNLLKLYLSIDNNSLHLFVNQFIITCLNNNLRDLDLKINNDESVNRRDNIVIYCNEENIGKYISVIKEVLEVNPNIQFNAPHLLGIPYDKNIYCGVDYDNGKTSYTDRICQNIFTALQKGYEPAKIAKSLTNSKEKTAVNIYALVDQSNKTK